MTKIDNFFEILEFAIDSGNFIKLILSKQLKKEVETEEKPKKITIRQIKTKLLTKFCVVSSFQTRDITKNFTQKETIDLIKENIENQFLLNTVLFSTTGDHYLSTFPQKNKNLTAPNNLKPEIPAFLKKTPPSQVKTTASTSQNKVKNNFTSILKTDKKSLSYLEEMGILDVFGNINNTDKLFAGDKLKQINNFIQLFDPYLADFDPNKPLSIVDLGCGKGYLTFAIYDYLVNIKNFLDVKITGIDLKPETVDFANNLAAQMGFAGLCFKLQSIDQFLADSLEKKSSVDIVIALHACDTATDDAIAAGINLGAGLIAVAPCCQKDLRKNYAPDDGILNIFKHGILATRQSDILTDTVRAFILEIFNYKTKIVEFISLQHSPKNLLIFAKLNKSMGKNQHIINKTLKLKQFNEFKKLFGIKNYYLQDKFPDQFRH